MKTKKDILRLTALSYSMVMISISDLFAKKDKGFEILKEFELIKGDEINDLVEPEVEDEKYFTPNGGAMMRWWIPLNRASRIVQEEQLPGNLTTIGGPWYFWKGICVSKAHKPVTLSGNHTFTKV